MSLPSPLPHSILDVRSVDIGARGTNFLRDQIVGVKQLVNPNFPTWALALLISFAVFRVMLIFLCIAIMAFPLYKGPMSRKRHYYLIRKVYSQEFRGMPYLVPNRSMVITLGEFFSSVSYLVSACCAYRFYTAETMPPGMHLTTWYALSHVPSYLGVWLAGWGLAHACFCDVDEKSNGKEPWVLTPRAYNSIYISWTLIVMATIMFWMAKVTIGFTVLEDQIIRIIQSLKQAADAWDVDPDLSKVPVTEILANRDAIYQALHQLVKSVQIYCVFLVVISFVLALFYLGTVRYLLRLFSKVLALKDRDALAPPGPFAIAAWSELEAEFLYLSRFSVVITLSNFGQIALWMYEGWTSTRYTTLETKLETALLDQAVGMLACPTLVFQSWRIVTERYAAHESELRHVRWEPEENDIPQSTAQLLGWDSTEHWGRRSNAELVTFSGICLANELESPPNEDSPNSVGKTKKPALQIDILRTTVVAEDVKLTDPNAA